MDVLYSRRAGLDVHSRTVVAGLLLLRERGRKQLEVRPFGTTTRDLLALRDRVQRACCTHIAMESTGELEPGARSFERMALPAPGSSANGAGFDDPARLDAFLDAVRWGAVSSADPRSLQFPFRNGIHIEDHQLDPMMRELRMRRVNLLVANDVGLGSTIEAGLMAQEVILRHRVQTVLVGCSASLQMQWRNQMRDKFGLDFRIVDRELMRDLRRRRGLHVNPWTHFPPSSPPSTSGSGRGRSGSSARHCRRTGSLPFPSGLTRPQARRRRGLHQRQLLCG